MHRMRPCKVREVAIMWCGMLRRHALAMPVRGRGHPPLLQPVNTFAMGGSGRMGMFHQRLVDTPWCAHTDKLSQGLFHTFDRCSVAGPCQGQAEVTCRCRFCRNRPGPQPRCQEIL